MRIIGISMREMKRAEKRMKNEIEYYLSKSVEELKEIELKGEILYHENHYIFVWFCQNASEEQLKALLDDEGIHILAGTDRIRE